MKNVKPGMARLGAAILALLIFETGSAGTVSLLKDLDTREVVANTYPGYLGAIGDRAIFSGYGARQSAGRHLFRSDGTAAGTVRVGPETLVEPQLVGGVNGKLVLSGYTDVGHTQTQLWVTDGTDAGTVVLLTIGAGERPPWLMAANATRLYFCASAGPIQGCELYVTDGTPANTVRLTPDRSVSNGILTATGGLYFFSAPSTGGESGLWTTDGTPAGTRALYLFSTLAYEAVGPIAWFDAPNLYINVQNVAHLRGLYRLNVDTGATTQIAPNGFSSFAENAIAMNGSRFFIMDGVLWRSDGTAAGTVALTTATPPSAALNPLQRTGNRLLFVRGSGGDSNELWTSDGTQAGTQLLLSAASSPGGFAELLVSTPDRAFFIAGAESDRHLWITDGTSVGTHLIPQRGGAAYSLTGSDSFRAHTVAGDRVFVTVYEMATGEAGQFAKERLWSTDLAGTDAVRLGDAGSQVQAVANRAFFANQYDPVGVEPWVSDGTVGGTVRVADLAISGQTEHSSPIFFTRAGGRMFFNARDSHGAELWITDGTAAGSHLVRDIAPGAANAFPMNLQAVGDRILFNARISDLPAEPKLWRSDGTETGTVPLGEVAGQEAGCGAWALPFNGRTWFVGKIPGSYAVDLWSTDGTAAGTRVEITLPDEIRQLPVCNLQLSSNGLVFTVGYNNYNGALWRTDGTLAGTLRLGNITPVGAGAGQFADSSTVAALNGTVYLLADDSAGTGRELWRTDGTTAGTALVADLNPGPDGAYDFAIRVFGNAVYFAYSSGGAAPDGLYRLATPAAVPELIKAGQVGTRLAVTATRMFFMFTAPGSEALWSTDGTAAGTAEVKSLGATGDDLRIRSMYAGDAYLFFQGPIDASGYQMWMTDGTAAHTFRLSNFAPNEFFLDDNWVVLNDRPIFAWFDDVHGSEPWTVTDQPPVAVADAASLAHDTTTLIDVRANDSDPDSAAAMVATTIVTQPAHGTLAAEGSGYRYTPTAGFSGSDSFQYRLTDELNAQSAIATVSITVTAPAPPGTGGGKKGGGGALDWTLVAMLALAFGVRRARRAG